MGTIDGPITVAEPALAYDKLARLRALTRQILGPAVMSLAAYRDPTTGGYFHLRDEDTFGSPNAPGNPSRASSATVVSFLVRTGRWQQSIRQAQERDLSEDELAAETKATAQRLLDTIITAGVWTSAELPEDNAFTVGFVLELIASLVRVGAELSDDQRQICEAKLKVLLGNLQDGRVRVGTHLPNSYLTDLASRVLLEWSTRPDLANRELLNGELQDEIRQEALRSVNAQLAKIDAAVPGAQSYPADVFELGYAVLLVASFGRDRLKPDERALLRRGLAGFFGAQRADGTWPRSQRLFTYPKYGDAYCLDVEFLARMLRAFSGAGDGSDRRSLMPYLPQLGMALERLVRDAVSVPGGGYGWGSGHHPQLRYPESWSTAACFDACDQLDRLLADAVILSIRAHLDQSTIWTQPAPDSAAFEGLLDSPIKLAGPNPGSLKVVLKDRFIDPILRESQRFDEERRGLPDGTAISVILYGPPGTSKTTYASAVAQHLGWPLISVDPSHLLRSGINGIHVELATIFTMLSAAERVVVFLDEVDELMRDREDKDGTETSSRLLTTSMLTRIVRLRESRRVVFLVATNHIEHFDPAIVRPGRFDLVLPVLPPTIAAKTEKWTKLGEVLAAANTRDNQKALASLTYDESAALAARVAQLDERAGLDELNAAARFGVMERKATEDKTWRGLMNDAEANNAIVEGL
jgi:hypothetical protein